MLRFFEPIMPPSPSTTNNPCIYSQFLIKNESLFLRKFPTLRKFAGKIAIFPMQTANSFSIYIIHSTICLNLC